MDGRTLNKLSAPIATRSNTSGENPIVADVDQDGHADILFTERYVWEFTGQYAQSHPAHLLFSKQETMWLPYTMNMDALTQTP